MYIFTQKQDSKERQTRMKHFDYSARPGLTDPGRFDARKAAASEPLVSIVTPFYNADERFDAAARCIRNQTLPWFEWILVDDGSTREDSLERLENIAREEPRARVLHQQNAGPAAARNAGAAAARTPYLMFMDADDLWEPETLELLWLTLEHEPGAAWAYPDTVTIGAREFLWNPEFSSEEMKKNNLIVISSMVRRDDFFAVGGFDVMGRYYNEDWHLWLKLLASGRRPAHVRQFLYWYRNEQRGAMQALDSDPELSARNREKIAQIAAEVPDGIRAAEPLEKIRSFTGVETWSAPRPLPFASEKRRILLLIPHMTMGGADKFNLDWLAGLDRTKYGVTVAATLPDGQDDWMPRFRALADEVFLLPGAFDMGRWPAFLDYLMASRGIDAVLCSNSYYGYTALPWLSVRHPDAACVDYIHAVEQGYRSGGYARAASYARPFLDVTCTCNEFTRNELVRSFGFDESRVRTVYAGVDETFFRPSADIPRPEELGGDSRPVILYPCRLSAEKRPYLMLEIVRRLPEYRFAVVGDGPLAEEIRREAERLGVSERIVWAGAQSDMRPWYHACAATLICSLREGLALTAYESLAMETPVVSCDVGGQSELVDSCVGRLIPLRQDAGDEGTKRVDPAEAQAYADALREVLGSASYQDMCRACRSRVQSGFTLSDMSRAMEDVLDSVLAKEARSARRARIRALAPAEDLYAGYLELYADYETDEDRLRGMSEALAHGAAAQAELTRIRSMRSYRAAERYRRWMQKPALARLRQRLKNH